MGHASFSLGMLARDGKTGKWSWKKSNRKKGLFEFESDTKSQRTAKKSKRKSTRTAAEKARQKAKADARWRKAQDRQSFKDRAEARHEEGPQPTVTVTGVRNGSPGRARPARVVQGQVVEATPAQRSVGSGQGVARMCGGKTREGHQCLRMVAPGSVCPHHPSAQAKRRQGAAT